MSDQPDDPTNDAGGDPAARRDELAAGLDTVRRRIADACARCGRAADEVTLTVVTKFFPASDVRLLAGLGVRHVGENRHQEAQAKASECADLDLHWHFIGGLQSNKAAAVASYAAVVESVDRPKLLRGLATGAAQHGRELDVLVQVDLDPGGSVGLERAGAAPADVEALARRVLETDGLRLRGVMTVAPLDADPVPAFARLGEVAARVRLLEPSATWVSAGMSGDLEAAVESGATHVRIGSAVLGARPAGR
jgi:pyridoxal phosphate enzyme (YggS family)